MFSFFKRNKKPKENAKANEVKEDAAVHTHGDGGDGHEACGNGTKVPGCVMCAEMACCPEHWCVNSLPHVHRVAC